MADVTKPRSITAHPTRPEWLQVTADAYLDHRHRNWVISEELGDVRFLPEVGVVLVHRERAEHVARALGAVTMQEEVLDALVTPREPVRVPAPPPTGHKAQIAAAGPPGHASRRRDIVGWLGILAGAAVFVAALAVPLDDPALVVALVIGVRGGRVILDVDS